MTPVAALLLGVSLGATTPDVAASAQRVRDEATVPGADADHPGTNDSSHRVGLELSPISPIVRIWAVHATYSIWRYGDLIAGYVNQNDAFVLAQVEFGLPTFRTNPPPEIPHGLFVMPLIWVGARAF